MERIEEVREIIDPSRKIRHLLILEDLDGFRLIPLEESSYFLGRDTTNSIVVRSKGISRQHALFLRVTNDDPNSYGFMLIDGNLQGEPSINGTAVNGEKCSSTRLKHGDIIVFGRQMTAKYLILGTLSDLEFEDFCQNFDFEEAVTRDINPRETFVHVKEEEPSFDENLLVRLASFPEMLPSPILEANLKGDLTYINPAACYAFPDLPVLGIEHPIIQELITLTTTARQKILSREVTVDDKVYEQSIHFIAESGLIRCIFLDISDRKQAEAELFKRDRLLQSVAEATTHLLANASHQEAIDAALARFGTTAGVDRICISENHVHAATNRLATSIRYEWTNESIESIRHFQHRQNQLCSNPHLRRWYTTLAGGAAISGVTHEFSIPEQTVLTQESVQSVLAVPIIVKNNFWGFIELHDCTDHYQWSDQEEAILRTLAASVSAALERQDKDEVVYSHLKRLQKVTEYVGSNLIGKDFSKSELKGKDFSNANLSGANLSFANLKLVIAIATNFTGANFTGACIQNWNVNNETIFDNVVCDFIYLKDDQSERRPHSGNFGPGEFATLVQKSLETIDLIFVDGIDWQAFFNSFQQLRSQFGDQEIGIQAIEKKGEDFVIRLEVPLEANKQVIETKAKELYGRQLQLLEQIYKAELSAKDSEISIYKKQSADLLEVVKLQSTRPINIEASAVADNRPTNQTTIKAEKIQSLHSGSGNINNYVAPEQQTLIEAATEIQQYLQQLEQTNPTASETDQIQYVNIATKPEIKQRVISALQAGGETALDEFVLDNKYLKVIKAIVKGWVIGRV